MPRVHGAHLNADRHPRRVGDRFAIRQDTNGGFLVSGGVYLTRGVYVEVARTGLGQAQTQVEWTIRPRFVLITSFLGNGDQRVSLRWRRESN